MSLRDRVKAKLASMAETGKCPDCGKKECADIKTAGRGILDVLEAYPSAIQIMTLCSVLGVVAGATAKKSHFSQCLNSIMRGTVDAYVDTFNRQNGTDWEGKLLSGEEARAEGLPTGPDDLMDMIKLLKTQPANKQPA
jgi:hypothetical protein